MVRSLLTFAAGLAAAIGVSGAPAPKTEPIQFISLKGHTNVKMDENLHSDRFENNNLKSLPTGKQKMGDVEFEIGEGVLQLGVDERDHQAEQDRRNQGRTDAQEAALPARDRATARNRRR